MMNVKLDDDDVLREISERQKLFVYFSNYNFVSLNILNDSVLVVVEISSVLIVDFLRLELDDVDFFHLFEYVLSPFP